MLLLLPLRNECFNFGTIIGIEDAEDEAWGKEDEADHDQVDEVHLPILCSKVSFNLAAISGSSLNQ